MDKTPYPLDTLKSWDLSGGGKFTLDALEFSPDIQDLSMKWNSSSQPAKHG